MPGTRACSRGRKGSDNDSDISHAMIYVEDRSVIDATAESVQARNTQRLLFEDECAVHASLKKS
jgi:hypothetical protein